MKNSLRRKMISSSTLTKANILPQAAQINPRPVGLSQMRSVFSSVPPLFGTAQAFLLTLAQLEAQLILNLIHNVASGNNSGNGNPFVPLNPLQPVGIQRSSLFSMHQCPGGFKNMYSTPHMVRHPSTAVTEINSVTARKERCALLAREIIQEKTLGPVMNNTTSEEALFRFSPNHLQCSQYQSVTAKAMMPPEEEPKQQTMLQHPAQSLIKALTSLGLSLEDLELLSHCPDNQLTTENLPFIIQDIQQHKGTKDIEYGHARWISSDHVESSRESSCTHGEQRNRRIVNGQRSLSPERCRPAKVIYKHFSTQSRTLRTIHSSYRPAEDSGWRTGSVYIPPRSKRSIRHSFVSLDCNKAIHSTTRKPLSSPHRAKTYNAMTKGHQFPVKSAKSEVAAESINIQMPVNKTTARTSAQTKGVIRASGIPLDYSQSELIKMASPFGQPVEVLMATEVYTTTCLEWKKALLVFPASFSAEEMVKVYSAIPVHMRQQSLELVSQTVDFSSPVSVFHAFVGPSLSNGLLTALDHLLVVCNVPNQPSAASGVLRLLKPFGQVYRALVLHESKVDVGQCLVNNSSIQMVLEMESASVALSVYEWSQKIPCLYHNHHLSFVRGCNVQKNTSEVYSA